MRSEIFVLERNADAGGHYPTQLAAIRELSARKLTLISNHLHELPSPASHMVLPRLRTDAEVDRNRGSSIERDVAALDAIFRGQTASSERISILAPSAADHDVEVLVRYAATTAANVMISVRLLADRRLRHLDDALVKQARALVSCGRFQIFAETIDFAQHVEETYNLQVVGVLALPCNQLVYKSLAGTGECGKTVSTEALRIFLPGGGRTEKGIGKYPALFGVLRRWCARRQPLHLIFQKPKGLIGMHRNRIALAAAVNSMISKFEGGRFSVTALPAFLDEETYARELQAAHLVLLPYDGRNYLRRGSGAVLDGVSACCRIAHTRGMGYSELLQHGNASAFDEVSGVPDALNRLQEGYSDSGSTDRAREALRSLYSESARLLKDVV